MTARNLIGLFLVFLLYTEMIFSQVNTGLYRSGLPTLGLTSNSPVCAGGILELKASGGESYMWTGPLGFESQDSVIRISNVTKEAAGQYQVIAKNGDQFDTLKTEFVITEIPQISIAGSFKNCEGDTLHLIASGGLTYLWNGGFGTNISSQLPKLQVAGLTPGYYHINLKARGENQCIYDTTISFQVMRRPALTIQPILDTVCADVFNTIKLGTDFGILYFNKMRLPKNDSTVTIKFGSSGYYLIEAVSATCSTAVRKFATSIPTPTIDLTKDTLINLGKSIILEAKSEGSITWEPRENLSCYECPQTIATPTDITKYCATANDHGCMTEKCVVVDVEDYCHSTMPNIISLSSQNNHSFCLPSNSCMRDADLLIYDRWGNLLHKGKGKEACWEAGDLYVNQVYTYIIKTTKAIDGAYSFVGTVAVVE